MNQTAPAKPGRKPNGVTLQKRDPLDRYYTPDPVAWRCVAELAELLIDARSVLEPSGGGGAFMRALDAQLPDACQDRRVLDADPDAPALLRPLRGWKTHHIDFLNSTERAGWIIGNPPYKAAERHCRHALGLADQGVAFLLRLAFLEGKARAAFWRQYPPDQVVVMSKRPSFTSNTKTDSAAYALFVWRTSGRGNPRRVLGWM